MNPRTRRIPELDALRGVACLMVLFAHLNLLNSFRFAPDVIGVAGVGIFFALSGFLITRILLKDRDDSRNLSAFYNRRVARIFPVYYLTLAVLFFAWPGKELLWAANFTFNFRFLAGSRDYFQLNSGSIAAPPIGHFWSLCCEEHFYWFWPLAVLCLPKAVFRFVPVAIICATPALTYWFAIYLRVSAFSQTEIEGLVARMTFTQLVAISIGALAAIHETWLVDRGRFCNLLRFPRAVSIGAAALAVGVAIRVYLDHRIWHHGTFVAFDSTTLHIACGGIFLMALGSSVLSRIPWLCGVGRVSYGIYVYHLPIYAALGLTQPGTNASVWLGLLALAATVLCAVVSFRFIESPILNRSKNPLVLNSQFGGASRHLGPIMTSALFGCFLFGVASDAHRLVVATKVRSSQLTDWTGKRVNDVDTIVVGSSHEEMGIAVTELDGRAYNLALISQDLYYDCKIAEKIVDRTPTIRRVILGVSAFSFRYAISDVERDAWRESLYHYAWGIESRPGGAGRYSMLALLDSGDAVERIHVKAFLGDDPYRGWRKVMGTLNTETGKRAAIKHLAFGKRRIVENRELLIQVIRHCQERGIQCVLVTMPAHRCYRENLGAELVPEFDLCVDNVIENTGALRLSYFNDPRAADADFLDGDHLNAGGAVKFSRILRSDLAHLSTRIQGGAVISH